MPHGKGQFLVGRASCPNISYESAVSCAKTAEAIEMRFRLWIRIDPRKHVLDGGSDPPREEAIISENHMSDYTVANCTKAAEPIEMPFGLWIRVGPRKHVFHGDAHWRNLANTIEPSMFGWAE